MRAGKDVVKFGGAVVDVAFDVVALFDNWAALAKGSKSQLGYKLAIDALELEGALEQKTSMIERSLINHNLLVDNQEGQTLVEQRLNEIESQQCVNDNEANEINSEEPSLIDPPVEDTNERQFVNDQRRDNTCEQINENNREQVPCDRPNDKQDDHIKQPHVNDPICNDDVRLSMIENVSDSSQGQSNLQVDGDNSKESTSKVEHTGSDWAGGLPGDSRWAGGHHKILYQLEIQPRVA